MNMVCTTEHNIIILLLMSVQVAVSFDVIQVYTVHTFTYIKLMVRVSVRVRGCVYQCVFMYHYLCMLSIQVYTCEYSCILVSRAHKNG